MQLNKVLAAAVLVAATGTAQAVNTPDNEIPYAAGFGSYTIVDSERNWDDDFGYQLTFGLPLAWEDTALELSFFLSLIHI